MRGSWADHGGASGTGKGAGQRAAAQALESEALTASDGLHAVRAMQLLVPLRVFFQQRQLLRHLPPVLVSRGFCCGLPCRVAVEEDVMGSAMQRIARCNRRSHQQTAQNSAAPAVKLQQTHMQHGTPSKPSVPPPQG